MGYIDLCQNGNYEAQLMDVFSTDELAKECGDELVEALKRGDITTSSFAFTVKTDEWTKREDGTYLRTIKEFGELYDISPVFREAYEETSVALRSLEEFKNSEVPADVTEQEKTTEQAPAEEQEQEQKQEEQKESHRYRKATQRHNARYY